MKTILIAAIIFLAACSKPKQTIQDNHIRTVKQVSIYPDQHGVDSLNRPITVWKVVVILDRVIEDRINVTERVKWHTINQGGTDGTYFDITPVVDLADQLLSNAITFYTPYRCFNYYTADNIQLVSISAGGYTFK